MLATRFGRDRYTLDNRGNVLSIDALRDRLPAVFAEAPHESRSDRYGYVPTGQVLEALRDDGWMPTFATQAVPRASDRFGFAKHMIRLRRPQALQAAEVPELVLINSHDGTTGFQMLAGMFRFICCNGMVVGDGVQEIRVRHSQRAVAELGGAAQQLLGSFDAIQGQVERMRAIELTGPEQRLLAKAAAPLRFENPDPVEPDVLLRPRRREDDSNTLWGTFNRLQENLVRGGVRVRNVQGKRREVRQITGIDQNVKLNRALWTLAEGMAALKEGGASPLEAHRALLAAA